MIDNKVEEAIRGYFCNLLESDLEKSAAVAAIQTLFGTLKSSRACTVTELTQELRTAVHVMVNTDYSTTSVKSASELFMRFISLTSMDQPNFGECKKVLVQRGESFIDRVSTSRDKITKHGQSFIRNNDRILTHSFSRAVYQTLVAARKNGKVFHVYVTGNRTESELYLMQTINCVLLGAEGVMETGGIINKIGSYTTAICAKELNKPVYVMAESIKFVKEYPLDQQDIPESFKYAASVIHAERDLGKEHPRVDYTPPEYIKLLFTDLGILPPHAVSDELIKLYL